MSDNNITTENFMEKLNISEKKMSALRLIFNAEMANQMVKPMFSILTEEESLFFSKHRYLLYQDTPPVIDEITTENFMEKLNISEERMSSLRAYFKQRKENPSSKLGMILNILSDEEWAFFSKHRHLLYQNTLPVIQE